jgi:hypothetical protein
MSYLDWFGPRVSNSKHIPSTVWISPRFKRKFIPNWYVLWYHYPTVMMCQKFGSISGGKLIKHNLSSRSREAILFFIMQPSPFTTVSPLNFWQVLYRTHYHIHWLKPIRPSNTGFHPLFRVAQCNLLTGYLPSSNWLRKIFYTEAWHKSLTFMTTTLPLPVPWCATLISLRTSTSPGQSLLDAPKYARKPFHWQLKIGSCCQNPTKA